MIQARLTALYASLLGIVYIVLGLRVILVRRGKKIALGDAADKEFSYKIRGHANWAEWVPFSVLLYLLLEITNATSTLVLHLLGLSLVIGRLLHGYTFSANPRFMFGRTMGTVLTIVTLAVEIGLCLGYSLS
jgi:uncharacterized membrane protein YecN with MAPEG domain